LLCKVFRVSNGYSQFWV